MTVIAESTLAVRRQRTVRQQHKLATREKLIQSARGLFAARGYDHVTVAEVAAGAGVTAKTAFQHFRTKDELLLAVLKKHHERLLHVLREREPDQTPLDAIAEWLLRSTAAGPPDGLERFQRTVGTSQAVAALRRRLYEEWEDAVAELFAQEDGESSPTPWARLAAAQLISLVRLLSSDEVRAYVSARPPAEQAAAREECISRAAAMLASGLPARLSARPARRRD